LHDAPSRRPDIRYQTLEAVGSCDGQAGGREPLDLSVYDSRK